MSIPQKLIPKILDRDTVRNKLQEFNHRFMQNLRFQQSTRGGTSQASYYTLTPYLSTVAACPDLIMPTGENLTVGQYYCEATNEVYWCNYNSNNDHGIYRLDDDGCRKVYQGACLAFSKDPKYCVGQMFLFVIKEGNNIIKKFLTFTNGLPDLGVGFVDVETSIATDSFNATTYPYWTTFYPLCDPCEFLQLGVRPPWSCPKVEEIPFATGDELLPNYLVDTVFQFATRFILTDGRITPLSVWSSIDYIGLGNCLSDSAHLPRCLKLTLDAGSALVEKVQLFFRKSIAGNDSNDIPLIWSPWMLYDTVDKYDSCDINGAFWLRNIALNNYHAPVSDCSPTGCYDYFIWIQPEGRFDAQYTCNGDVESISGVLDEQELVTWLNTLGHGTFYINSEGNIVWPSGLTEMCTLNSLIIDDVELEKAQLCGDANTWEYTFCGDKQCIPISRAESDRLQDDVPKASFGLTPANDKLLLGNNLHGFNKPDCAEIDKITYGFDPPDNDVCHPEYVKIRVPVFIHNNGIDFNQSVNQDDNLPVAFGGIGQPAGITPYVNNTATGYKQTFADGGAGFPCFLEGAAGVFKVVTKQYIFDQNTADSNPSGATSAPIMYSGGAASRYAIGQHITAGNMYVQLAEFFVPKGKYVFRIGDQNTSLGSGTLQYTSTFVAGLSGAGIGGYNPQAHFTETDDREIFIDACAGDVDTYVTVGGLVVYDLTLPQAFAPNSTVIFGYLTDSNLNSIHGIELLKIGADNTLDRSSRITDHNGFFFVAFYGNPGGNTILSAGYIADCAIGIQNFQFFTVTSYPNQADGAIIRAITPMENIYTTATFHVTECGGGETPTGIQNIPVGLTRGKFALTDANGIATIKVRPDSTNCCTTDFIWEDPGGAFRFHIVYDHDCGEEFSATGLVTEQDLVDALNLLGIGTFTNDGATIGAPCYVCGFDTLELILDAGGDPTVLVKEVVCPPRTDKVLLSQNGSCFFFNCDDCDCIDTQDFSAECSDFVANTNFDFFWQLSVINLLTRGLKGGATYRAGLVLENHLGQQTFVQTNDNNYVMPPFLNQTGIFQPSTLFWKADVLPVFPAEFTSIMFVVTSRAYPYIQWIVSKLEFLDGAGNVLSNTDPTGASKIRIYIQGLLNYNSQNNFKTNTNWEFTEGDRVRFMDDGNNVLYQTEEIDLLAKGDSATQNNFIVDFDQRLFDNGNTLSVGAWIEPYHPKECTDTEFFKEMCPRYALKDGKIQVNGADAVAGTHYPIDAFDTYYVNRAIPQNNGVYTTYHPYEHYAVTDFWGNEAQNGGRVHVINPYERELWSPNEVMWSDSVFYSGSFINGVGTWRIANRKDFFNQAFGDMVFIWADRNSFIAICEHDNLTSQIDLTYVRAVANGQLLVNSEGYLSQAAAKVTDKYGCAYEDRQSIVVHKTGLITWADALNANFVVCNYTEAKDFTKGVVGYFNDKIRQISTWNKNNPNNKWKIHAGKDELYDEVILTFFLRNQIQGNNPFVFTEADVNLALNESLRFDLIDKAFTANPSYTPEAWIHFSNSVKGQQLVGFVNSKPYLFNNNGATTFNNFFGVQCKKRVKIVYNGAEYAFIIKHFGHTSVDCNEHAFLFRDIITQSNQTSYIPLVAFSKVEGKWYCEFFGDTSEPNPQGYTMMLADGSSLYGEWIESLLEGDPLFDDKYCELNAILIDSFASSPTKRQ